MEIKNDHNNVINFSNNTNVQAKLDATGNFSIGQTSIANYFGIGTVAVLWHNGNTQDIFVGAQAGNSTMTGHNNSLVGYTTGNANTSGQHLTFIGYQAGKSNTSGGYNTAIGSQTLYSNPNLFYYTAIGYQAMYNTSKCSLCYSDANCPKILTVVKMP